jgi:hypothetical protein
VVFDLVRGLMMLELKVVACNIISCSLPHQDV